MFLIVLPPFIFVIISALPFLSNLNYLKLGYQGAKKGNILEKTDKNKQKYHKA